MIWVTSSQEYKGLVKYLLGRVLVVDHIDHAIMIARKFRHSLRMVTIEGESLNPGGSMTGGAFAKITVTFLEEEGKLKNWNQVSSL